MIEIIQNVLKIVKIKILTNCSVKLLLSLCSDSVVYQVSLSVAVSRFSCLICASEKVQFC